MAKVEKLTPAQEALMHQVRQEWLDRLFHPQPADHEAIRSGVKWLYGLSNLKEPVIIIVDSPMGAQMAAHLLKQKNDSKVGAQVRAQVGAQVWAQVRAQVWAQVRAQVRDQVGAQVRAQVWAQVWAQVGDQKMEFESFSWYGNCGDFGWVSFYDFFQRIGLLTHEKFDRFNSLIKAGAYDMIQSEGVCIVCTLPIQVSRDRNNRMHSETGPAIEWKDGFKLYYLSGVYFDEQLWRGVIEKTLSAKEVMALPNQEQKSVALRVYGWKEVVAAAGAKVLASHLVEIHGQPRAYEVIEVNLGDDDVPARFVKVVCWTTEKEALLRIDPRDESLKDPVAAIAWTFGSSKEDYVLQMET